MKVAITSRRVYDLYYEIEVTQILLNKMTQAYKAISGHQCPINITNEVVEKAINCSYTDDENFDIPSNSNGIKTFYEWVYSYVVGYVLHVSPNTIPISIIDEFCEIK